MTSRWARRPLLWRYSRWWRRAVYSALGGLAIGTLLSVLVLVTRPLSSMREGLNDMIYPDDPGGGADSTVVIAAIDEKTLGQVGGRLYEWPRSVHAQAIDNLATAGARVISFDILFAEESPDDAELARAIRKAGNVIMPVAGIVQEVAKR